MMKTKYLTGILFLLMGIVLSCERNNEQPEDDGLPETVSFSEHIQPFFTEKCIQCHGGVIPPNLSEGEAYGDLTSLDLIDTDNPELSILYIELSKGGHAYAYASDTNRAMILKWITQGAKDN